MKKSLTENERIPREWEDAICEDADGCFIPKCSYYILNALCANARAKKCLFGLYMGLIKLKGEEA